MITLSILPILHAILFFQYLSIVSSLDYQIDYFNPSPKDNNIKHVQILSSGQIQVFYSSNKLTKCNANLKTISQFNLNTSIIYDKLDYFNDSLIVLISESKNSIIIYSKTFNQISFQISLFSNILFAKIVASAGSNQVLIILTQKYLLEFTTLNSTINKILFNLTDINSTDIIIDYCKLKINNSSLEYLIGTQSGKVYQLIYTFISGNLSAIVVNHVKSVNYQIKKIIVQSQFVFFSLLGKNLQLNFFYLSNFSLINHDPTFNNKQLLKIQTTTTDVYATYFLFTDSLVKVSIVSNTITNSSVVGSGYSFSTNQVSFIYPPTSSGFNFLYQKQKNLLYKWNICTGNSDYFSNQNKCKNYTCNNPTKCYGCSLEKGLCTTCATGYIIDGDSSCVSYICSVQYCQTCQTVNYCLDCQTNYTLTNEGACISTGNNQTSNTTLNSTYQNSNNTNSTNSSTSNSNSSSNSSSNTTSNSTTNGTSTNQNNSTSNNSANSNSSNNNTANNNTANNNASNNSTLSNSTNQTTALNQSSNYQASYIEKISSEYINQQYESISNQNPSIQAIIQSTTVLNSVPILRSWIKFLAPFFAFFDDYWYYIYHENQYYQLQTIPGFLILMYEVNQQRIMPNYINTEQILKYYRYSQHFTSNYSDYTFVNILQIDEQDTYFIRNIQDMICFQYMLSLGIFIAIRILLGIGKLIQRYIRKSTVSNDCQQQQQQRRRSMNSTLQRKFKFLLKMYSSNNKNESFFTKILGSLRQLGKVGTLIESFIQANLIFLMYQIGVQFKVFFSFETKDKINSITTLLYGIACILYVFTCYRIKWTDNSNKSTKRQSITSSESKYSNSSASSSKSEEQKNEDQFYQATLTFQIYFICMKNMVSGLIHSIFMNNNFCQLILLGMMKTFFISLCLWYVKRFKTFKIKLIYYSSAVYYFIGISFDVVLILSKLNKKSIFSVSKSILNRFEYIICFGLLIAVIFQTIIHIFNLISIVFCNKPPQSQQLQVKSSESKQKPIFLQSGQNSLNSFKNIIRYKFNRKQSSSNIDDVLTFKKPHFLTAKNQDLKKTTKTYKNIQPIKLQPTTQVNYFSDIVFRDDHKYVKNANQSRFNVEPKTINKKNQSIQNYVTNLWQNKNSQMPKDHCTSIHQQSIAQFKSTHQTVKHKFKLRYKKSLVNNQSNQLKTVFKTSYKQN